jgi:DNA-binding response OmpR family regulator
MKKNIMIIDDEPHIVNLVRLSLNNDRYNIMEAYSAREALQMIKNKTVPDLVLVDIMMPNMDGYELCRILKKDSGTKSIPLIILSAKNQLNDKLHAIDVGADDYITKPFDPDELAKKVQLSIAR